MPLPSELLVETIRMDQAARMQRWQTERFEIEQQCRRDPEQCPPLFDVAPSLSRPPITEGVVVSPQDTNGGQASPAPDKRAE